MCAARARRRRIAAATPSARSCLFAVITAARGARAAIRCKTARDGLVEQFEMGAYVCGRGREQYAGCLLLESGW